jgi:hypothetical protein
MLRKPLLMAAPACMAGNWETCLGTFNGVAFVALAALPVAALAAWVLSYRPGADGRRVGWRTSLAEVGMVYGTLPWVWITMLPGPGAGVVEGRVSLVPLRDLATMDNGQIIGNLLILAALGFFAPIRFPALASVPRIVALGVACSAAIEVAQYVLMLDRVSSIDDVLLNASGAGLAAIASWPWWRGTRRRSARGTAP